MDSVRGFEDSLGDGRAQDHPHTGPDAPPEIGSDERRMHVRAYNHWVSLLQGRAYPSIEDLDPNSISDFGPHSVLLDFSMGIENPAIQFLGRALREECDLDASIKHIADVPPRSLLSRLTDHYLQIIANRAPIGFEAEFMNKRGLNTLYRGILMPYSSDEDTIDFIYGVINWKELVDAETQAALDAEVRRAVRHAPSPATSAPVWADGPSGQVLDLTDDDLIEDDPRYEDETAALADRLVVARETAAAASASDGRSRIALYRALGRAYDFALAAESDAASYAELLEDAGLTAQARAPMTPVVKLVFGASYDKTRLTEFATALAHGKHVGIAGCDFARFLNDAPGGLKGVVAEARRARRPEAPAAADDGVEALRARPALASVTLEGTTAAEFVVLVARTRADGSLDIVAALDDAGLTARALRSAARG